MSSDVEMDEFDKLLQDFIDSELKDVEERKETKASEKASSKQEKNTEQKQQKPKLEKQPNIKLSPSLQVEEKALMKAWLSFAQSTTNMAETYGKTTIPKFDVEQESLIPRYKPHVVEDFTHDTLLGWIVMLETYPNQVGEIHPNSSDEQILNLAEKTSDPVLQDALISYVEILIELEACDLAYQTRLLSAKKNILAKQAYEAHEQRREKIKKHIKLLEDKKFPINAENLVLNYYKVASRDPEGARETLITNPAVFAPIELDKIPQSVFGSKPKPEDGFKWNKKIAKFLRKLKM